jgi:hypothetical protein
MVDVTPARESRRTKRAKPKFETYSFDVARAHEVLEELISAGLIKTSFGTFPTSEQMRGKHYCKFHNVWTHTTASCIKLKDQIQEWINEGKIQFEAAANVEVAMVEFNQAKRNRRRPTLELVTN